MVSQTSYNLVWMTYGLIKSLFLSKKQQMATQHKIVLGNSSVPILWKRKRRDVVDDVRVRLEAEFFMMVGKRSSARCQRVVANNKYLLRLHGRTFEQQKRDLWAMGWHVAKQSLHNLSSGRNASVSIIFLEVLAWYWQKDLVEMMSVDYEAEDLLRGE